MILGLLTSFQIPRTGLEEARQAFLYLLGDFEDAMQVAAAVAGNSDYLISRDGRGFGKCLIPVVTPEKFCDLLKKG
ncbi:MAG: putative nucleic acid-binding protein [Akkermansiaceae bacterium]